MLRISFILYLFILIGDKAAFCQGEAYRSVDSIMRNYTEKIKSADELYKVVYFIRQTFQIDSLRLRASFIWITENINYDIEGYQKEDPRSSMLDYVIKNKKAVCGGYAGLLKFFCDAFNIESTVIFGTARATKRDVNINQLRLRTNHTWNAVKINNSWRLIDPTWATGSIDESDENNIRYFKDFKEEYYFTPPEKMIFNHFPDQYQHQFLSKAIPEIKFKKWPLFTTSFLNNDINGIYPDTALIRTKFGDTINFKIRTGANKDLVYFIADDVSKTTYSASTKRDGEWLSVEYPVKVKGNYNMNLGYSVPGNRVEIIAIYRFEIK